MTFTGTVNPNRGGGLGRDPEPKREFPGRGTTAALIVGFFAAFAVMFTLEEQRRIDDPVLKGQRGEITHASTESLLRETNLARALKLIDGAAPKGSTLESLRITPTDVGATVAHPDGRRFDMRIDAAFALTQERNGAARPSGPKATEVDPATPAKLLVTTERKLKLQPRHLDYVLLSPANAGQDEPYWGMYYSEPPLDNDATAAFDGTDVRLIGEPSAAQRKLMADQKRQQDELMAQMEARRKQILEAAGQ